MDGRPDPTTGASPTTNPFSVLWWVPVLLKVPFAVKQLQLPLRRRHLPPLRMNNAMLVAVALRWTPLSATTMANPFWASLWIPFRLEVMLAADLGHVRIPSNSTLMVRPVPRLVPIRLPKDVPTLVCEDAFCPEWLFLDESTDNCVMWWQCST